VRRVVLIFLTIFSFFLIPQKILAQSPEQADELMEGKVIEILDEGQISEHDQQFSYQNLKLLITRGSLKDHHLEIENYAPAETFREYQLDDQLRIHASYDFEEQRQFVIDGVVKRQALLVLTIIFVLVVLLVGRKWGAFSILGLVISFFFIFKLALPLIVKGVDPILVSFLTTLFIIPVTFYISHGFNKKTHIAVLATFLSLLITVFLAFYFVNMAKLTGFASEEANFVDFLSGGKIDIFALMMAGIIIGVVGILDDVTVSQSAFIKQLVEANPKMTKVELYKKGMELGQDHISSMVNTLVLVYAGSSLPLLLLFLNADKSFIDVVELEIVAEEVIRTLVGSIGLVLAAPISTILAVLFFSKSNPQKE
jgi:uncharacterized membrane protein